MTPHGVFAAKLMWGYLGDFAELVRGIEGYAGLTIPQLWRRRSPTSPTSGSRARTRPRGWGAALNRPACEKMGGMYDHVALGVTDLAAARAFYEPLLGTAPSHADDELVEWQGFDLAPATTGRPLTRGLHIAFSTASPEQVDAIWQAAVDDGCRPDGDPGPRPQYGPTYYGAFLRDPDGNSVELVHREARRLDGAVDHLWIRVADADSSKRFYDAIAETAGLHLVEHEPGAHVHYSAAADGRAGLRLVTAHAVTGPLHIAFGAGSPEPVQAFHATATAAGYRDNGGPGERPEYHSGPYGAFVLDPDGHNIEVVFHDR